MFANMLEEGSELEIVKIADVVESTRRFFESELPARVQSPRAALMFHCGGRKLYAEATGRLPELASVFSAAPPCAPSRQFSGCAPRWVRSPTCGRRPYFQAWKPPRR